MADFQAQELAGATELNGDFVTPDSIPVEDLFVLGAADIVSGSFKMRALANPGPGYVSWVVTGVPDFSGGSAPSPIISGSAIVDAVIPQ